MPKLILNLDSDFPRIHELVKDKITIGRTKDNTIPLKDTRVSVFHAEMNKAKDGSYRIKDLDSQNGTTINGKRIKEEEAIKHGDKIEFGAIKAIYLSPPAKEKPPEEPKDKLQSVIPAGSPAANLPELEKEARGLMRKSQIERNNLKLLEDNLNRAKAAGDQAEKRKSELEKDIERLTAEIKQSEIELKENKKESEETAAIIKEAKVFDTNISQLEALLKTRQTALDELEKKFAAKELAIEELDLESAQKKKEALEIETERLSEEISKKTSDIEGRIQLAKSELEKNQKASVSALEIIHQGQAVEKGIVALKEKLQSQTAEFESLDAKVAERNQLSAELAEKIEQQKVALVELTQASAEKERELDDSYAARQKELETALAESVQASAEKERELNESYAERQKELETAAAARQQEAESMAATLAENQQIIDSASEKLQSMETAYEEAKTALNQTVEEQESLLQKSGSLSRLVSEKSAVLEQLKKKIDSKKYGQTETVCPPIRVINPWLGSLVHYYHHGAGVPDQEKFEPIGSNGLAACTKGSLHRDTDSIISGTDPVLALLSGDLAYDKGLIDSVARDVPGTTFLVCWSEGVLRAMSTGMNKAAVTAQIKKLLSGVAGMVSVDPDSAELLGELDLGLPHLNIPLPSPVGIAEWNLSAPTSKRTQGVFISCEGFDSSSQIHRARVELINSLAASANASFTVYHPNCELPEGIAIPADRLTVSNTGLRYSEYLANMGKHHFVTGFGNNCYGTNNVSDTVLARAVFIGGDSGSPIDELLFPNWCIKPGDIQGALEGTVALFGEHVAYAEAVEHSQSVATQLISFQSVGDRLSEFLQFVSSSSNHDGV